MVNWPVPGARRGGEDARRGPGCRPATGSIDELLSPRSGWTNCRSRLLERGLLDEAGGNLHAS
jgi:hypothetical protein